MTTVSSPAAAAQRLPLALLPSAALIAYILLTLALFFWGPIEWPVKNVDNLVAFMIFVLLAITLGGLMGCCTVPVGRSLPWLRGIIVVGAVASIVVLPTSAYIYTGKLPWEALGALGDQKQAYLDMQGTLAGSEVRERIPLVLARVITYPFMYAVIPLGILNWSQLSTRLRVLLGASVLAILHFSILRGTDREIADLLIVAASTVAIYLARLSVRRKEPLLAGLRTRTVAIGLVLAAIAMVCSGVLFVERRAQRYDGVQAFCVDEQWICPDFRHSAMAGMPGQFAAAMSAAYLSQGYYGLSLALDMEWQPTYGIGHSQPLNRLYVMATGDEQLYERSYTYRLRDSGWTDDTHWSTMFPWLANDVGFVGTVPLIWLSALLWCVAWRDAIFAGDNRAAVVFVFLSQLFAYLPANSQLTLSLDAYTAFLVWTCVWLRSRASN